MRQIPGELRERIETGAATLCHVWLLKRSDGVVTGFTDHDGALELDGVVCPASSGWTAGMTEGEVGLTPGTAVVAGVLDDDSVTEPDIAAGVFDQAEVTLWRVDWRRPDLKVRLWVARMTRVRRDGGFLGRKFFWVTEVTGFDPGRHVDMAFVEGPMKGGVSYEVRPDGEGAVASVHNRGGASFSVPGMAWMLRKSVAKDLERLAAIVEGGA